jgi:hypothetical protein
MHVSNPETQAENVLMRKWSITSEQRSPDVDALIAYNTIYRSPLGSAHHKAIRALFTDGPSHMDIEVGC